MSKERTLLDVYEEATTRAQTKPGRIRNLQASVNKAREAREGPQGQYDKLMNMVHRDDHLPSVPELFLNDLEVQAGRRKPCPACMGEDGKRAGVHNILGPWTCAMCRGRGLVEV